MLTVYLDNCMFNRPFDNQSNMNVWLETQAKLYIQALIRQKRLKLAWSYMLDLENDLNPHEERRIAIGKWRDLSSLDIEESEKLLAEAQFFLDLGIKAKDALHVACAVMTKSDYFLSTDIKLIKKLKTQDKIKSVNPLTFMENLYEN